MAIQASTGSSADKATVSQASCSAMVSARLNAVTLAAAKKLADEEGFSVEVIDLRSLKPVDWEAIGESVRKTSRVMVAYEDQLSWGYGAEIAARIADEHFSWLDAPVRRVASADTFVAYAPELENETLPQAHDLEVAMREMLAF